MIEGKPLTDSLRIDTARLLRLSVIPLKAFCLHGKEKVLSQTAQRGILSCGYTEPDEQVTWALMHLDKH